VFDGQAGLHQNTFRDYDPATGRYVESDPIGLRGGVNTYTYSANGPIIFFDPFGQMCLYSQLTGNLTCVNDVTGQQYINCDGYSGQGQGYNNPELDALSGSVPQGLEGFEHNMDAGPVPRGYYRVGAAIQRAGFGQPVFPIYPLPFTNMWGRNHIQIHGDSKDHPGRASNGCIILGQKCRAKILPGETLQVTR
jgi:RHS repeat-associated protein